MKPTQPRARRKKNSPDKRLLLVWAAFHDKARKGVRGVTVSRPFSGLPPRKFQVKHCLLYTSGPHDESLSHAPSLKQIVRSQLEIEGLIL